MYNQPSNLEGWSIVDWVTQWGPFDPRVVVLTIGNSDAFGYRTNEDNSPKIKGLIQAATRQTTLPLQPNSKWGLDHGQTNQTLFWKFIHSFNGIDFSISSTLIQNLSYHYLASTLIVYKVTKSNVELS